MFFLKSVNRKASELVYLKMVEVCGKLDAQMAIPKNYGKQVISFAREKNKSICMNIPSSISPQVWASYSMAVMAAYGNPGLYFTVVLTLGANSLFIEGMGAMKEIKASDPVARLVVMIPELLKQAEIYRQTLEATIMEKVGPHLKQSEV